MTEINIDLLDLEDTVVAWLQANDDDACAPIVQALYEWVQLYGPEYAKSDAKATEVFGKETAADIFDEIKEEN